MYGCVMGIIGNYSGTPLKEPLSTATPEERLTAISRPGTQVPNEQFVVQNNPTRATSIIIKDKILFTK